jgi:hypothetical protein
MFKKNSILSAFRKSGIFPLCPNIVLERLRRHEPVAGTAREQANTRGKTGPEVAARPATPELSQVYTTPTTIRSLKRQGEELLKHDTDLEFRRNQTTYLKRSQAQAEAGGLALEQLNLTETAIRAQTLQQQRSRARL